jgi:hypothetical protein
MLTKYVRERDLMSSLMAFKEVTVNDTRTGPALRCSKDNHGPSRMFSLARISSLRLNGLNLDDNCFHSSSHCLMHGSKV